MQRYDKGEKNNNNNNNNNNLSYALHPIVERVNCIMQIGEITGDLCTRTATSHIYSFLLVFKH